MDFRTLGPLEVKSLQVYVSRLRKSPGDGNSQVVTSTGGELIR